MSVSRSILVRLSDQSLELREGDAVVATYPVSTASRGAGELEGSYCTPRGLHVVRDKIGAGQPLGAVFRSRCPTGEVCDADAYAAHPDRDWILTRILWLSGLEEGRNLGGRCDTYARYIYIHGTPDEEPMGVARSHGCIRMRNRDVAELFDMVDEGTIVRIVE